jgi:hypothetical protein
VCVLYENKHFGDCCFKVLNCMSPRMAEENQENPLTIAGLRPIFETSSSQTNVRNVSGCARPLETLQTGGLFHGREANSRRKMRVLR